MRQTEFESLMFVDVEARAAAEAGPRPGKPKYYGRPWTQLREEMVTSGAKTVGELSTNRVAVYYHSTKPADRSAVHRLRRLVASALSAGSQH